MISEDSTGISTLPDSLLDRVVAAAAAAEVALREETPALPPSLLAYLGDGCGAQPQQIEVRLDQIAVPTDCPPPDKALIDSIRRVGVLSPVSLEEAPDPAPGTPPFRVVAGRRRVRAALLAGRERLPAVVYAAGWVNADIVAAAENAIRSGNILTDVEAVERLRRAGMDDRRVRAQTGMTRARLKAVERVRWGDPRLRQAFADGWITEPVLLAATALPRPAQERLCARWKALPDGRRVTDRAVREMLSEIAPARQGRGTEGAPAGQVALRLSPGRAADLLREALADLDDPAEGAATGAASAAAAASAAVRAHITAALAALGEAVTV